MPLLYLKMEFFILIWLVFFKDRPAGLPFRPKLLLSYKRFIFNILESWISREPYWLKELMWDIVILVRDILIACLIWNP